MAEWPGSAPPLGLPYAGARPHRTGAAPRAAAVPAAQAPRAARALLAGPYAHAHGAAVVDAACHIDGGAAFVDDRAVADRETVAIGGVARAAAGDDEHAPVAVIRGTGGGRSGREGC